MVVWQVVLLVLSPHLLPCLLQACLHLLIRHCQGPDQPLPELLLAGRGQEDGQAVNALALQRLHPLSLQLKQRQAATLDHLRTHIHTHTGTQVSKCVEIPCFT